MLPGPFTLHFFGNLRVHRIKICNVDMEIVGHTHSPGAVSKKAATTKKPKATKRIFPLSIFN